MTDINKKPYTLDEMLATDTLTARYMGGYNNGLADACEKINIKELKQEVLNNLKDDIERKYLPNVLIALAVDY